MRKLLTALLTCLLLSACSTRTPSVNPQPGTAWQPFSERQRGHDRLKADGEMVQDGLRAPNPAGISGTLLLAGVVPTPLNGVRLQLSKFQEQKWVALTDVQTTSDGRFQFTRSLAPGQYRLKVLDERYQGEWPLELQNAPVMGLYLEAHPVSKK